jgi:transposase, IS5 family
MNQQRGFFDEQDRLELISKQGDPLEKLNEIIPWEIFRKQLKKCFAKEPKGPGGRPAFDFLMMFKVLILQRLYNLSDYQMQYQLLDRLSFQRFIDLGLQSTIPDEKTIWLFRETLTRHGVIEKLFQRFKALLESKGVIANTGSIIDASFVEVPRQRNTREENKEIKEGKVPADWKKNPAKESQKDTDARWTKKNEQTFYGYKDHVKVDKVSKIITAYTVTDASVHDSQAVEELVDKTDEHHEMYADSAYVGARIEKVLEKRSIRNRIHEKGYRNRPLTKRQIADNRKKSSVRVRVEHVFGHITNSMKGFNIRTIGIVRCSAMIGMINLTYNMVRFVQLRRA